MVGSSSFAHDTSAQWLLGPSRRASHAVPCARLRLWVASLAVALVSLWSHPACAESLAARLSLKKGSEVQIAVLKDGFHVGVMLESSEPHAIADALDGLHPESIDVQPVGRERVLATLRFERPIASARAALVREHTPARKRPPATPLDANAAASGNSTTTNTNDSSAPLPRKGVPAGHVHVDVLVTLTELREALGAHVLAQKLPLPETLAHHRLWDAEEALVAGRLAEAQLMFEGLNAQGSLVGWSMLRLGDLAVHNGMESLACGHYERAAKVSDVRVPSTLAGMRARILRCAHAPSVDYHALLSRVGRDDPVGRRLASEARFTLGFERDVESLDTAVSLGKRNEVLPSGLYDALAARRLRLRDPMQRVLAEMRWPIDKRQEEALDLHLSIGQALCALDVPERWHVPDESLRKWWSASRATSKKIIASVKRCEGLDTPETATALSRASVPDVVREFRDIETRVGIAKRAAARKFSRNTEKRVLSKAPTAPPSTPPKAN